MVTAATTADHENLPATTAATTAATTSATRRLAEIASVPRAESGKVLSSGNIGIATALTLLPIPLGLASAIGGIAAGVALSGTSQAAAAVCIVTGLAGAVASVVVLVQCQQFLPSRYLRCVARRAFSGRKDPLVPFDDATAEFVDIVPRSNWGRTMAEPASDVGLFAIDHERRELLFEGDRKRYRIPFAAVSECMVEAIRLDSDEWGNDLYYATVLTIETETGPREVPFCGRQLTFRKRRMPQRCDQAEQFCVRILTALNS